MERCGKGTHTLALSLQVWALPCLYPSNWNAKPEGYEQTWLHQLGDLFSMMRTMMNERFLNMSWCVQLGLEPNQGNGSKIQSRSTSYSDCYSGLELTWLVLVELCTYFTFCLSHTHLSLAFRLPGLAWRELAWPGDKAVCARLCKSCTPGMATL